MNENLTHGLTFKTHWENQETQEWEEPSDGSSYPKMHEAEGGVKNARQQTVQKNKQANQSPIWP